MKINSIEITNLRNHQATSVGLDQINIFVGRNNSGKSTIKAAIEYALTGRCGDWTDGAGRGAEDMIRHGAAAASVKVDVGGLGGVSRSIPNALQVSDWKGALKLQQEALYEKLGAGADVISAALNTGNFLAMKPDEQKNMLFRLMGLTFDEKSVTEALESYLSKGGKSDLLTPEFYGYLKQFAVAGITGPESIDRIYSQAYKERTGAKKALKDLETLAGAAATSSEPPVLPPRVLKAFEDTMELARLKVEINEQLQGLKTRKEELIGLRGQVLGGKEAKEVLKKRYEEAHDSYEAAYEELKKTDFSEEKFAGLSAGLEGLAKKTESARVNLEIKNNLVAEHKKNLDTWTATLKNLKKHEKSGHCCPLAPELKCGADIKAMMEVLTRNVDAVAKIYESARQEAVILEQEEKEAAARHEEARIRTEEYGQAGERVKKLAEDLKEYDRQKKETMAEIEKLDALAGTSLDEIGEEINQLSQRIPNGEELIRNIEAEDRVRTERARTAGALEKRRQEVAWLETLVEAFGPKGFKSAMLGKIIGPIQERANERLALLGGGKYSIEFVTEKDFEVVVRVDGQVTRRLSTSERMRVGIILQDVLSGLTGLRLLVIDDCEILDPVNKSMLIGMLLQVRDDYDTIIILSALGETQPRHPGIPGLSMFLVEDGAVRQVPAPAAA